MTKAEIPALADVTSCARSLGYTDREIEAGTEAWRRAARHSHPDGEFDKAGRFTLTERHACCETIRAPSRSFPYPEMQHGRSVRHVAAEFGVEAIRIQRLRRAIEWSIEGAPADGAADREAHLTAVQNILVPKSAGRRTASADGAS